MLPAARESRTGAIETVINSMYCHTTCQVDQLQKRMKTTPVTPQDFTRSVLAVPPLCMGSDGMPCAVENRRLVESLSAAGITTFVYGGNANLFHLSCSEFAATLEQTAAAVPDEAWLLPSIGPDFGKARDQIAILRALRFPAAMLLPGSSPSTLSGVADGVRRLADALGAPLVLYLKSETYIAIESLQALMREGKVCGVKYAVPRSDPSVDDYLKRLVESCGADNLISGFGERPAVAHCRSFGIKAFTSGLVCIAPHLSFKLLGALARGSYDEAESVRKRFLALEDLRDAHSPISVLHAAVAALGIADTGPITPFMSNVLDAEVLAAITAESKRLRSAELDP